MSGHSRSDTPSHWNRQTLGNRANTPPSCEWNVAYAAKHENIERTISSIKFGSRPSFFAAWAARLADGSVLSATAHWKRRLLPFYIETRNEQLLEDAIHTGTYTLTHTHLRVFFFFILEDWIGFCYKHLSIHFSHGQHGKAIVYGYSAFSFCFFLISCSVLLAHQGPLTRPPVWKGRIGLDHWGEMVLLTDKRDLWLLSHVG